MSEKLSRILMVDDEWDNVESLEEVIDRANIKKGHGIGLRDYAAHPDEAVTLMKEAMETDTRYSVIITDNHMRGSIDGDQFLRLITGRVAFCWDEYGMDKDEIYIHSSFRELYEAVTSRGGEDEVSEFLQDHFENPQEYLGFVEYFFGEHAKHPILILLCGNPQEAKLNGIEDLVEVFHKVSRRTKGGLLTSERALMNYLVQRQVFTAEELDFALRGHPRLDPELPPIQQIYRERRPLKKKKKR